MPRVLLVEDEAVVRTVISRELMDAGYEVVESANGMAALECAQKESFDLVITDSIMPGISGAEFVRRLRECYPSIPVIHITGTRDSREREFPRDVPTFHKPFPVEVLLNYVRQVVPPATTTSLWAMGLMLFF